MPRGDGTGPMGIGPMTGRGAGYCNGFSVGFGGGFGRTRGFGCGFDRGFGYRRMVNCYPQYMGVNETAFDEKKFLNNQAEFLENQLQQIKKRLSSMNQEAE